MLTKTIYLGTDIKDRLFDEIIYIGKIQESPQLIISQKVHEIRKAFKRMRSLVRLLKPFLHPGMYYSLDTQIGSAGNLLAGMRDKTVNYESFQQLMQEFPGMLPETLSNEILRDLALKADEANSSTSVFKGISNYMRGIILTLREDDFKDIDYGKVIQAGIKSYCKSHESFQNAQYTLDSEIIHKWRKQAKYFYLQLKFAPGLDTADFEYLQPGLHELTDILGRDHDFYFLEKVLRKDRSIPGEYQQKIYLMISKLRARYQKRAFQLGAELFNNTTLQSLRTAHIV